MRVRASTCNNKSRLCNRRLCGRLAALLADAGSMQISYLFWLGTEERAHLEEAKGLLEEAIAHVPDDKREVMLSEKRLYREIGTA